VSQAGFVLRLQHGARLEQDLDCDHGQGRPLGHQERQAVFHLRPASQGHRLYQRAEQQAEEENDHAGFLHASTHGTLFEQRTASVTHGFLLTSYGLTPSVCG